MIKQIAFGLIGFLLTQGMFAAEGDGAASRRTRSKISSAVASEAGRIACVIAFAEGVSPADMDALLQQAGVTTIDNPDLLASHRLVAADVSTLVTLSHSEKVAAIFPASLELLAGAPVHSCSNPVQPQSGADNYTLGPAGGWSATRGSTETLLTWSLARSTSQLTREQVTDVINRALAEWSKTVMLRFSYTTDSSASRNLAFSFVSGEHGDPYPFDGRGGILAHAFYPAPLNSEPLAGDLHIDNDETWSGTNPDLFSVLLHEIGHSLGLVHSDNPNAVMYPYYRRYEALQAEDIAALQKLYPVRTETTQSTATIQPAAEDMTVTIAGPSSTEASSVDLTGTVSGGSGTIRVTWTAASAGGTAEGGRSWKATAIPLGVGTNTITINAKDDDGSTATKTATIVRSAPASPNDSPQTTSGQGTGPAPNSSTSQDKVAPAVTITSPGTSVYGTSASRVKVSGIARDGSGVVEVTWQCRAQTGTAQGTAAWSFEVPLLQGDNQVIVRARDSAGNIGSRSVLITRR